MYVEGYAIVFTEAILTTRFQLGFRASRQRLKDFVTPVADVDHVVLFRRSTSGWIRVTGFENFCAAFRMSFLGFGNSSHILETNY